MKSTKSSFLKIIVLLLAIAVTGLGTLLTYSAQSDPIPDELRALLIKQPIPVPEFHLVDQENKPFSADRLKGAWTFMFFGYTHCPDVCPTTLTELDDAASLLKSMQTPQRKIQYAFISVDPVRDTPKLLGEYVSYFGAKFIAATGKDEELKQLANPLGIKFEHGINTGNEYIVNHSSAMLLIDPKGRYYARFRAPHYSEDIADGFKQIVTYAER